MSLEDRRERGTQLLQKMLGAEQAEQTLQHWKQICPEFGDYVVEFLSGEIWSRPRLDRRIKSLVTIATLAGLGRTRALDLHIRMATRNGATRQEITETLLHIAPYAGFPASWEALAQVDMVFSELDSTSSAE